MINLQLPRLVREVREASIRFAARSAIYWGGAKTFETIARSSSFIMEDTRVLNSLAQYGSRPMFQTFCDHAPDPEIVFAKEMKDGTDRIRHVGTLLFHAIEKGNSTGANMLLDDNRIKVSEPVLVRVNDFPLRNLPGTLLDWTKDRELSNDVVRKLEKRIADTRHEVSWNPARPDFIHPSRAAGSPRPKIGR